MATQVVTASVRLLSNKGPWTGLDLLNSDSNRFITPIDDNPTDSLSSVDIREK
jgi:hypothetical protein